jgi:hypothetical protein
MVSGHAGATTRSDNSSSSPWVALAVPALAAAALISVGAVFEIDGVLAAGIVLGFIVLLLLNDYFFVGERGGQILGRGEPTRGRVHKLIEALSEATRVMDAIRREVEVNQRLVDRLQADVKTHEQLLALHSSEVEAVAQVVAGEVRREGRRGLYAGFLVNAFFFGLGVLVTLLLT